MATTSEVGMVGVAVTAQEVEAYLNGIDFPASKNDLLDYAYRYSAPQDVLDTLNLIPGGVYSSFAEIHYALQNQI